jgi:hypothetical protein
VDEHGNRRQRPMVMEHLLSSLKDAEGDDVTDLAVPLDPLPPEPAWPRSPSPSPPDADAG